MSTTWRLVRGGESGAMVHVSADGTVYAKSVTTDATDELRGERDRTEWLVGRGIGCPTVLDWTEDASGARLLTSRCRASRRPTSRPRTP